ncbi:MAG: ATP-dependent DNA helicase PcrA [Clostridia bacterium]|nr:ATP-dependent DNA helicase PcrA [Clostridia bacterium]
MVNDFEKRYIRARKKVIEADFARLNPMQREAVMATEGPLLVLAGAGSGKTTVLINRIANMLRYGRASDTDEVPEGATEEDLSVLEAGLSDEARKLAALDPVEPWRIIAITFTNKAADALRSRLETMLGDAAEDIWVRTFHSACVRILRGHADRLGYPNNFTIYDTSDRQSVIKAIIREMDLDEKTYPPRAILERLDAARNELLSPAEFEARYGNSGDPRLRKIAEVYKTYTKRLFSAGAMDFDDLLYNTVRLFRECPDVLSRYQRQFKYVLIDEYQDTNNLQYLLASMLAGGWGNICVVGDDDQSIYKFRGATIENILNFEKQYTGCRTIRLEQNYRSTGHILDAANALISNNTARKGKTLWTDAGAGDKILLYAAQNEDDEAQYVAGKIMEDFGRGGKFRDNAVLYRMNAQSNRLEFAFKRNGIPYRIVGGMRFFDRAEVKDMLAYLWAILLPADDLRLIRIINSPQRGIGDRTVEIAQEIAAKNGKSLYEVVSRADEYPDLSRAAAKLIKFTTMMDELRESAQTLPLDELYDEIIERTGYIRALEQKRSDENLARIENVYELKTNILGYIKETGDTTLSGFLDEVALYTDLDSLDADADCAVMMTMHSAKGLEFPNVLIVGAEEGIFPGLRSIGDREDMEEERRLCYVALTRAKNRLYITCARQRMIFGRTSMNRQSRFLDEIPLEHMDRAGYQPPRRQSPDSFQGSARRPSLTPPVRPTEEHAADFGLGDRIVHTAFGHGEITKVTPMGGDALIEIKFDDIGMKRLMLRAASQHMQRE